MNARVSTTKVTRRRVIAGATAGSAVVLGSGFYSRQVSAHEGSDAELSSDASVFGTVTAASPATLVIAAASGRMAVTRSRACTISRGPSGPLNDLSHFVSGDFVVALGTLVDSGSFEAYDVQSVFDAVDDVVVEGNDQTLRVADGSSLANSLPQTLQPIHSGVPPSIRRLSRSELVAGAAFSGLVWRGESGAPQLVLAVSGIEE